MNQLLLGASFPFLAAVVIYAARRCRATFGMLVIIPILTALSMLWAVAPDLPRLFGFPRLYHELALDPRCDIFFWHYSIDMAESDSPWFAVGLVLIFAALLAAAWRELYLAERN